MAKELGPTVEIHGVREHAFPGPQKLKTLEGFPGLTPRKVEYLRRPGREAAEQMLEAAFLRYPYRSKKRSQGWRSYPA